MIAERENTNHFEKNAKTGNKMEMKKCNFSNLFHIKCTPSSTIAAVKYDDNVPLYCEAQSICICEVLPLNVTALDYK